MEIIIEEIVKIYEETSSPTKLCFAQKCILGEWLYNVTKGVSKSSVGCSKVCENNSPRWSVPSCHMAAECGIKPLSAIICLMKWGAL